LADPRGRINGVKLSGRIRPLISMLVVAGVAAGVVTASELWVRKEVDLLYAPPSATLSYSITVSNLAEPAVDVGLFSDEFPDQLGGCTWTCAAVGGGWCEAAAGSGDISQLLSVPVGASVSIAAACTFAPSAGHECAANVTVFSTMDPDTTTRGFATTCEAGATVFFDGFEGGTPRRGLGREEPRERITEHRRRYREGHTVIGQVTSWGVSACAVPSTSTRGCDRCSSAPPERDDGAPFVVWALVP
jgi:hypothetical protein